MRDIETVRPIWLDSITFVHWTYLDIFVVALVHTSGSIFTASHWPRQRIACECMDATGDLVPHAGAK